MEFLDYDLGSLAGGTVIKVTLSAMANVYLLDPVNFRRYFNCGDFYYQGGGLARRSPYCITVPHTDTWHIVVDLACGGRSVHSSVEVIKPKGTEKARQADAEHLHGRRA